MTQLTKLKYLNKHNSIKIYNDLRLLSFDKLIMNSILYRIYLKTFHL